MTNTTDKNNTTLQIGDAVRNLTSIIAFVVGFHADGPLLCELRKPRKNSPKFVGNPTKCEKINIDALVTEGRAFESRGRYGFTGAVAGLSGVVGVR